MFKELKVHAHFNERTGYGVHASRFFPALDALVRNCKDGQGEVHISLLDVVTASQTNERYPRPSILFSVWESTEYPAEFLKRLSLYDQFWVPSEAQRAWSIAQGIPEEFVKVVPEGVDPEVYKPEDAGIDEIRMEFHFNFLHVGQWQPRKSTKEIVEAFLKAFPRNKNVRLYLSVDTLFPSDEYKSTEERLKAYGLEDPRIIPVHFEERDAYIRRLQAAHCFVSCSRSEGWGLPIIEAMACGIPTIVADFGGSTEYAADALVVPIRELKKPHGIYGNWDVPGQWGEPDYDVLVKMLKDAYKNYAKHKEKALKTSEMIRTKFSWQAAAEKAYKILEELSAKTEEKVIEQSDMTEKEIRIFAARHGYTIKSMEKRKAVFTVDAHPDTQEKMDCLTETIRQIKNLGYPIVLSSHLALPKEIIESVDFYIYDKKDVLSGDDKPVYWRTDGQGKNESIYANKPCHALAAVHNVRNAVDFCRGRYDWIYQMSSDTEVDLEEWLNKVHASDKDTILVKWEGQENTVSGQITAAKTEIMDKILLRMETWEDFKQVYGEDRFCSERKYFKLIKEMVGIENIEFLDVDIGNRFDQVDREAWEDDLFTCHFVEGATLNIAGLSGREYDVVFNDTTRDVYTIKQKPGMWSRPSIKYYRPWTVTASLNGEEKFKHVFSLEGRNVMISMGSKALGDTIAWMPYIEEFRKKHKCHIVCSGWWQEIFDYPEIEFIKPGSELKDIYASYDVGCFDNQLDKNPINWRSVPLQKVAADILGLEYEPIKPRLKYTPHKRGNGKQLKPYVCFSEFSTMQNKMWNRPGAWQKVIDYLNSLGYDCVSVSAEPTGLANVIKHNGQGIHNTIADIAGCEFYVGLNHGPSWIAYSLGKPVIFITGVSEEWNDFPNSHRISVDVCKPGCFNDPSLPIDRGWLWCGRNRDFICTREVAEELVIREIDVLRREIHETHEHEVGKKEKRRRAGSPTNKRVRTAGISLGVANNA